MSKKMSDFPFAGTRQQEHELRKGIQALKEDHTHNDALMPALQLAQGIYGYLPVEVQKIVSEELDIFLETVYGVATFYSQFTLIPKGKYNVQVCMGTACYVKGSGAILNALTKELGFSEGVNTTPDGKFSLEACRCIGACGLAPVITINEDVYGRLKADDIAGIIGKYRAMD